MRKGAAVLWMAGLTNCGLGIFTLAGDAGSDPTSFELNLPSTETATQPQPIDGGIDDSTSPAGIAGTVAVVGGSGVGVTVRVDPGGLTATTDMAASFFLTPLLPGDYTVRFQLEGFPDMEVPASLAAGQILTLSETLMRSSLVTKLTGLDGGYSFRHNQALGDAGAASGLFLQSPRELWRVGAADLISIFQSDAGYQLLGFDQSGGPVVSAVNEAGNTQVAFLDPGQTIALDLGGGVVAAHLAGNQIFYQWAASDGGRSVVSEFGRDDPAPTLLAGDLIAAAVFLQSEVAAYQVANHCLTPVVVGFRGLDHIVDFCSYLGTLNASLDGERVALGFFGVSNVPYPQAVVIATAERSRPDSLEDVTEGSSGVLAERYALPGFSHWIDQLVLYPLTDHSYAFAGATGNQTGGAPLHLAVVADGGTQWESDVLGWVPLHGTSLLAAGPTDGGVELLVFDGDAGAPSSLRIPFNHEWSPPVFTSDNRYAVFLGVPSLFDLERGLEVPLKLTPASVAFNRSLTELLVLDPGGNLGLVPLGGLATTDQPVGLLLEGVAIAAGFTADEQSVAYVGTGPLGGDPGLFAQALPGGN